jgi:hypothetical protein
MLLPGKRSKHTSQNSEAWNRLDSDHNATPMRVFDNSTRVCSAVNPELRDFRRLSYRRFPVFGRDRTGTLVRQPRNCVAEYGGSLARFRPRFLAFAREHVSGHELAMCGRPGKRKSGKIGRGALPARGLARSALEFSCPR